MFESILSFFGLKSKTESIKADTLKEPYSIKGFINRPIYKKLTAEILDQTPDDELVKLIFDNLSLKPSDDLSDEYKTVLSFNKEQRAIYTIWLLEGNVNNGGFDQFYSNSSGRLYTFLLNALKLIGAPKFADLVLKANNIYEIEQKSSGKNSNNGELDELDSVFYKLYQNEDLAQLELDFIRKNKNAFID